MVSNFPSTTPAINQDGTISAIVQDAQPLHDAGIILRLWLPIAYHEGGGFGRYFLVRCAEDTLAARAGDWSIYGRRAIFCAAMPTSMPDQAGSTWVMWLPHSAGADDASYNWLRTRPLNSSLNLLGPLGTNFALAPHTRALVAIADLTTLPHLLPVVQQLLDQGGRVTLLIRGSNEAAAPLLPLIPIPVEVRVIPLDQWLQHLAEPVRWADQLCAALPNHEYASLARHIGTLRFKLDNTFAHVLVESALLCGVGACLACVVPTREGSFTRACVHGPVFPLSTLAH